jgi:beta-1,2-N-acetylglucosaminyltransferase
MKPAAREVLKRLGSRRSQVIGWRDMWAMVAIKGGKMFGESYAKSTEFNTWGAPVILRVEVPLVPLEESECDWPDTDENRRRRQFCGRIEGYGSVCSCADPAPLVFNPAPLPSSQVRLINVILTIVCINNNILKFRGLLFAI